MRKSNSKHHHNSLPPATDDDLLRRKLRFGTKPQTTYGYVSRGEDNRLQNSLSERKAYFDRVMEQFAQYCSETNTDEVHKAVIAHLTGGLGKASNQNDQEDGDLDRSLEKDKGDQVNERDTENKEYQRKSTRQEKNGKYDHIRKSDLLVPTVEKQSLDQILSSLRKLREALLHLPPDEFSKKVHIVSVRISANMGHFQTYLPSMKYLLENCEHLLSPVEIVEMATLMVLHLVHFSDDVLLALKYYFKYLEEDGIDTKEVIMSWIHKDYYTWTVLYNKEMDNLRSKLMSMGVKKMVTHMVECMQKSYFNYPLKALILPRGVSFEELQKNYGVSWEKNQDNIIIRARK